jgi:hypothetical protein
MSRGMGLACCLLSRGTAPTANKCWEGIDPETPAARAGHGCEWQVLTPTALPALREDKAVILRQIEVYGSDPGYAHFLPKLRQKLGILRKQIARAEEHRVTMICGNSHVF